MRRLWLTAAFLVLASPAVAEVWIGREGDCGEWQARWIVQQEATGVWVGNVEYRHVGGPCERPTGEVARGQVRAVIAGDNFFAVRTSGRTLCMYAAQRRGQGLNRARGTRLCEGTRRLEFALRFRSPVREQEELPPPDDELLREEGGPGMRFEPRGLEDLFGQ